MGISVPYRGFLVLVPCFPALSGCGVLHFRLHVYPVVVMRSTPSNHFELSKWLRRWTLADFPHKLVHGSPDISLSWHVGSDSIFE